MNNKLLIETLEEYKLELIAAVKYSTSDAITDSINKSLSNIETLLSELKEPSLEEKQKMFESEYTDKASDYEYHFNKNSGGYIYAEIYEAYFWFCNGKGWEV